MSELSLHQRIANAAASQEVENVKARHTYYHGRADATGEWDNIWAMNDDASWGARLRPYARQGSDLVRLCQPVRSDGHGELAGDVQAVS